MPIAHVLVFVAGLVLVLRTLLSAIRTFVVPRGANDWISSLEFQVVAWVFQAIARPSLSYERRDRIMVLFAPIGLVLLPVVLLALVLTGYTAMYWAISDGSVQEAFRDSGSALLTLGFASVEGWPGLILAFTEAAIGLILVALLIAYLPTMYTAFQRREGFVAKVAVRAGTPPSGVELLIRFWSVGLIAAVNDLWIEAESWFMDLEESHTTLAALAFYRSPRASYSWILAAGAILDGASLLLSTIDLPADPRADLAITAGYRSLDQILGFFRTIVIGRPARPDDPILVTRSDFDQAVADLAAAGLPIKADLDQAWRDFAGWRVNYDNALLRLSIFVMAPEARWNTRALRLAARELTARPIIGRPGGGA
jgi:hypothetical protein